MSMERPPALSVTCGISSEASVSPIAVKSSRSGRHCLLDYSLECQQDWVSARTFSRDVIRFNWFKYLSAIYKEYENFACGTHDLIMGLLTEGKSRSDTEESYLNIL
jgi:hypothetical protein